MLQVNDPRKVAFVSIPAANCESDSKSTVRRTFISTVADLAPEAAVGAMGKCSLEILEHGDSEPRREDHRVLRDCRLWDGPATRHLCQITPAMLPKQLKMSGVVLPLVAGECGRSILSAAKIVEEEEETVAPLAVICEVVGKESNGEVENV